MKRLVVVSLTAVPCWIFAGAATVESGSVSAVLFAPCWLLSAGMWWLGGPVGRSGSVRALAAVLVLLVPQCDPPAAGPVPVVADAGAPAGSKCGQWFDEAVQAGWSADQWPILDQIMWRESRCRPDVHNGRGRDRLLRPAPAEHACPPQLGSGRSSTATSPACGIRSTNLTVGRSAVRQGD
jgi:hypothetical protein